MDTGNSRPRSSKAGFTLVELLISVFFLGIIAVGSAQVFQGVFLGLSSANPRAAQSLPLTHAAGEFLRDLRAARDVQSPAANQIRFKDASNRFYVYYFHPSVPADPAVGQLRKTEITSMNASFTSGTGDLIADAILLPQASSLSYASALAVLDLSIRSGSQTLRLRSAAKPRNR